MSIAVSEHAIDQHFKRFGGKQTEQKRITKANKIRKVVAFGWEVKPKRKLMKLLNHKCAKTKYFVYGEVVVVFANEVAVTVYKYKADDWIYQPIN